MYNFIKICIINILFLFVLCNSQTIRGTYDNPINGHQYILVDTILNWTEASKYASQNFQDAYLATITTQSENTLILENLFYNYSGYTWIGANAEDSPDSSVFKWATGPEAGLPLYDRKISKCFGFCSFYRDEPDSNNQRYIYIWRELKWDDYADTESYIAAMLLEKGGLLDPVIIPTDMIPSIMVITGLNLNNFNTQTLTVQFTNSQLGRPDFNCSILTRNLTTVTCQTEYTVGEYDIVISDGTKQFISRKYHPNLPYITSMIPGFLISSILTINGRNFGDDIKYVDKIIISTSETVCTPLSMIVTDRSITCRLTQTIIDDLETGNRTLRYSLMHITVGGILMTDFSRIPIYERESNSLIMYSGTYYIHSYLFYIAEGMSCYQFGPITPNDVQLVRTMMNVNTSYNFIHKSDGYYFSSGPYNDQLILNSQGINTDIITGLTFINPEVLLSIGDTKQNLSIDPYSLSFNFTINPFVFVKFDMNRGPPKFQIAKDTLLPTTGGWFVLGVDNLLLTSSSYGLTLDGVVFDCQIIVFTDNSSVGIYVREGTGPKKNLTFYVENQPTTDISTMNTLAFNPPILFSIQQSKFNNSNGNITISGMNFGNDINKISISLDNRNYTPSRVLEPHTSIVLQNSFELRQYNISINVDSQISNSFLYTPNYMVIDSTTPVEHDVGGNVTIYGRKFTNPLNITIGGVVCSNPVIVSSNMTTCYFDGSAPYSPKLLVVIDSQNSIASDYKFQYTDNSACGTKPYCSGNGNCTSGTCQCVGGFGGAICDQPGTIDNNTTPIITNNTGKIGDFTVFFTHLRELDSVGNDVAIYPVSDIKWNITTNTSTIITSIGSIDKLKGFYINVTTIIFLEQQKYWFAGQEMTMERNSFKYQIELSSYPFSSKTNSFQLIYQIESPDEVECSKSSNTFNDVNNLLWIQVQLGNKVFLTKFQNRMIIDSRIQTSNTILLSKSDSIFKQPYYQSQESHVSNRLVVAMVLPSFEEANIDPNFSVLVNNDSVEGKCSKKSSLWWISLIVLGAIALGGISIALVIHLRKKFNFKKEDSIIMQRTNQLNS